MSDMMNAKQIDKMMNSKSELASEILKSEKKLEDLRNLQQETRSKIFTESAWLRYMQDRLKWLEEKPVSNDTRPERN